MVKLLISAFLSSCALPVLCICMSACACVAVCIDVRWLVFARDCYGAIEPKSLERKEAFRRTSTPTVPHNTRRDGQSENEQTTSSVRGRWLDLGGVGVGFLCF